MNKNSLTWPSKNDIDEHQPLEQPEKRHTTEKQQIEENDKKRQREHGRIHEKEKSKETRNYYERMTKEKSNLSHLKTTESHKRQ